MLLSTLRCRALVLAAFAAAGATGHAQTVRVAGDPSSVDSIFSDIEEKAPGCALGAAQNGVTLLSRQYGYASLEHSVPITADTVFDAASVSKQFTAFAILLLAEEGKLSLQDQVRKHVPELPDYGMPITIRHLLHHTSGLRDYGDLFSLAGSKAANPVTKTETYDLIFKQKALNFRPGTQRQYNNTGYLLLGRIVEKIAGKPLKVFAAERIFRPLKMGATYFQDNHEAIAHGRAWGYRPGPEGTWLFSLPANDTYGPSNLFTTIGDLLQWQQNFTTARVGSKASLAAMQKQGQLSTGAPFDYGLGLEIVDARGLARIGHSGGNEGFNSVTMRFPQKDLSLVVLCNFTNGDAPGRAQRVADALLGLKPPTPGKTSADASVSLPSTDLSKFAGTYRNPETNDVRELEVRNGSLIYLRGAGPTLIRIGPNRFRFPSNASEIEFVGEPGAALKMRVIPETQPAVVYEAVPSFRPTAKQLRDYEGEFYSEEIETSYAVTAGPRGLSIRMRLAEASDLKPVYRDAFVSGDLLVRFTRNQSGQINGLLVDQVRVRNLKFDKRGRVSPN